VEKKSEIIGQKSFTLKWRRHTVHHVHVGLRGIYIRVHLSRFMAAKHYFRNFFSLGNVFHVVWFIIKRNNNFQEFCNQKRLLLFTVTSLDSADPLMFTSGPFSGGAANGYYPRW